jgi:hypothetical protein
METPKPLETAAHEIDRALGAVAGLERLISLSVNVPARTHLDTLSDALKQAQVEIRAGSQLIADQAAHIRELSVVVMNSAGKSL